MTEVLTTNEVLTYIDIQKSIVNFEKAYPMEMSVLRLGGVYPGVGSAETVNPYTDEIDTEYFGNIGEHCVSVAECADILIEQFLGINHPLRRQTVSRALVHDAGKRFEIMRKKAVKARKADDAYSPKAYETIRPILEKAGVTDDVIGYMARAGQETGHNSMANFISVHNGQPTLITDSLPDMIVHLADDMTFTPIVGAGETTQTSFVTVEERMKLSDFPNRYPFLYKEGFGFDRDSKLVMVKDVSQAGSDLRHVRTYADWQVWVANKICGHLVSMANPQNQIEKPGKYIKRLVNTQLELEQRNITTGEH